MRISKRQRARVVELLRCAADCNVVDTDAGIAAATDALWPVPTPTRARIWDAAFRARLDVKATGETNYLYSCLEAALRVEQGWSP